MLFIYMRSISESSRSSELAIVLSTYLIYVNCFVSGLEAGEAAISVGKFSLKITLWTW